MINFSPKSRYNFEDLLEIMRILRSEEGCPWDREQTHETIRMNFLEEAYEAAEAIDCKDPDMLCEELGDVLLQVVFHARMEEENGGFTMNDVADGICKKLILRHPHIFGEVKVKDSAEVLRNWDKIKQKEKGQRSQSDAIEAVAKSLPALMRAQKIQAKAAKVGFDWPDVSGAMDKTAEEMCELSSAISDGEGYEEELGDLLFSCVNIARFLHIDAERALEKSCDKFALRFKKVEEAAEKQGKLLKDMSLSEMDKLWDEVKKL